MLGRLYIYYTTYYLHTLHPHKNKSNESITPPTPNKQREQQQWNTWRVLDVIAIKQTIQNHSKLLLTPLACRQTPSKPSAQAFPITFLRLLLPPPRPYDRPCKLVTQCDSHWFAGVGGTRGSCMTKLALLALPTTKSLHVKDDS